MTVTCQSHDSFVCLQLREEVYGELANVDQVAGGRERVLVITLWYMYVRKTLQQLKVALSQAKCVHVFCPDSCCPILLKVPTLWGSFEIKNVRLAKIMLRQLSG